MAELILRKAISEIAYFSARASTKFAGRTRLETGSVRHGE